MKMTSMYMPTLKEVPKEAQAKSHQLLLRAGMIRALANGLFAYLPLGLLVFRKIENIIREEMNNIGALEFKPPVVAPSNLWQSSGRWYAMGEELLRFKNRLSQDMVLSPTAEEVFTFLLKGEASSYKDYPIFAYQINTKYRDEIRPRYALMRAREFTMKDAYSFHTTKESLDEGYLKFVGAYQNIFRRLHLSTIEVKADSGAMGGSDSQEFMVSSDIGDDILILCSSCGYAANQEKASSYEEKKDALSSFDACPTIEEVSTPNIKTIEELTNFLHCSASSCIKTLIYHIKDSPLLKTSSIAVCIRGDLDVNEAKLASFLQSTNISMEEEDEVARLLNCRIGFLGPVGLKDVPLFCDESVMNMEDAITGALKVDAHIIHVFPIRDFKPDYVGDFRLVKEGDACPVCKKGLHSRRGNELGHVFKLGDKYTRSMDVSFLDATGKKAYPLMGCYGIGIDRLMAALAEEYSDEAGLKWPISVCPYHVAIVPINMKGATKDIACDLYESLQKEGIEVLFDDRDERVGVKFKDIDLIGVPLRVVVSDKNLPKLELKERGTGQVKMLEKKDLSCEIKTFLKNNF